MRVFLIVIIGIFFFSCGSDSSFIVVTNDCVAYQNGVLLQAGDTIVSAISSQSSGNIILKDNQSATILKLDAPFELGPDEIEAVAEDPKFSQLYVDHIANNIGKKGKKHSYHTGGVGRSKKMGLNIIDGEVLLESDKIKLNSGEAFSLKIVDSKKVIVYLAKSAEHTFHLDSFKIETDKEYIWYANLGREAASGNLTFIKEEIIKEHSEYLHETLAKYLDEKRFEKARDLLKTLIEANPNQQIYKDLYDSLMS